MSAALYGDEPEPEEQLPAGRLCVPVRPGSGGCVTRLFRTPVGGRTAVVFTAPARLQAVLGAGQPWIVLAEPALRALMEPLGVRTLRIDPVLTAPAPATPGDPGHRVPTAAPARPAQPTRSAAPVRPAQATPVGPGQATPVGPGQATPVRPLTAVTR
ncbi:SAV_915 family protein [Streptomyces sp. NPDC048330]|uniref:SAV_915 family protein n=1 Tax=Streptomyces sp. NPDC048330 TaxID=3365533 RepID=UPI0037134D7E